MFLHVGAANYRSWFWVNGKKACEHEGGFTSFDCDVTGTLRDGENFIVAAVDNTRLADRVPTLQTDWWNYGGLTRDVALVEVPGQVAALLFEGQRQPFMEDLEVQSQQGAADLAFEGVATRLRG